MTPRTAADGPDRFIPRYYEIEQALRARVAALRPGDAMPSDAALCQEFEVSRMTARNAMQRLVQEGIVERIPGRGTFVAEQPVHRQAGNLISFSDEMRRRGRRPRSELISRRIRAGEAAETRALGLADGAGVVELARLRLADDEPIAVEHSVFAASLAPTIMAANLETGSLFAALVGGGRVPTAGRASLAARAAGAADARRLAIPKGSPLLVERRLIFDQDGHPLELTESRYAGDRYALDVAFEVELG
jgi:GntR family transcriptional regulator